MGSDAIGPRTWLLVAAAGWAVLAWLLALLGMGGVIQRLPDDPALVQRLPQLQAAAPERLGPLDRYAEMSARPLFSTNRQPEAFVLPGQEGGEATQSFDFVLTSVLLSPDLQMAILQPGTGGEPVRLRLGDSPQATPDWRVVQINPRSVVFAGPQGQQTLELRVFDGTGGQPPTALQAAATLPQAVQPVSPQPGQQPMPAPTAATAARNTSATAVVAETENGAAAEPVVTTEQQMDLIRKRIEARRAKLREQGELPPTPDQTK